MSSKGGNPKQKFAPAGKAAGAFPEKKSHVAATNPSQNNKNSQQEQKPKQNLQRQPNQNSDAASKKSKATEDVDTITEEDLLMPGATWFHMYENLPALDPAKQANRQPPTRETILALKTKAEKLYDELVQKFEKGSFFSELIPLQVWALFFFFFFYY